MAGRDCHTADAQNALDNRPCQRRAFNRIGASTKFIKQHQRIWRDLGQNANNVGHVRGKRG